MRVIFIGSSLFGLRCLLKILEIPSISVVGVLTNPKNFTISYSKNPILNVLHVDFVKWAEQYNLPCYEMTNSMRDENLLNWVSSLRPELLVVSGWYHIVPKQLREIAPAIGLHASLLPDYSGGAPLVWAMINGERKTGITLFQMDDGVDSGPIIGQAEETILDTDTISTLYARIETRGIELLDYYLPMLAANTVKVRKQNENARRTFPQRSPEDGWIDWNQDVVTIDRFIRAQTRPYPGAFTSLNDGRCLTIWAAKVLSESGSFSPGSVTQAKNSITVQCATGSLLIQEVGYEDVVYGANQLNNLFIGTTILGIIRSQKSISFQ